jgi:predicted nucleic acid-binding protein
MKKVFVDTNVLIDLLAKRQPFYDEAAKLFTLAEIKKIELSVSSLTIANTAYILLRELNALESKQIIRKLRIIVRVLPVDEKVVDMALNDNSFTDFEDAIQYFSALDSSQDVIITRNLRDFKQSRIPVMTAEQFLRTL